MVMHTVAAVSKSTAWEIHKVWIVSCF